MVDFGAIAASGSDDDAVVSDAIVELVGSGSLSPRSSKIDSMFTLTESLFEKRTVLCASTTIYSQTMLRCTTRLIL